MKKTLGVIFFVIWTINSVLAQPTIDSLEKELASSRLDTTRVLILSQLAVNYSRLNQEVAAKYAQEGIALGRQLNFKRGEADCMRRYGIVLINLGRYPEALEILQRALTVSQSVNDNFGVGAAYGHIGRIYAEQGNYSKARFYFHSQLAISETIHVLGAQENALRNIGNSYFDQNMLDSARIFYDSAYTSYKNTKPTKVIDGSILGVYEVSAWFSFGNLYAKKGEIVKAMIFLKKCVEIATPRNDFIILNQAYLVIADLFQKQGQQDSCIFYAQHALEAAQKSNYSKGILAASALLSKVYESIDEHEAFKYSKLATSIRDSLFNTEKSTQLQNLFFVEQQRQQSIDAAAAKYENQLKLYTLLFGILTLLIVAVILYRNNRHKQKANTLLQNQKIEIQKQRIKAENALEELKSTQNQLIHSEKMASLGELTAGVAHEIQNPLNFINNFSDVNAELIDEMQQELNAGNEKEAVSISNIIKENEQKINHHGKRADSIVKGMLQHSRNNTGQKELTDINTLADEYLRLSYHGLKAKEKSFNATIQTDFDKSIPKVNIIPQDFGRALLNLYNNAFYAIMEKKKSSLTPGSYEPIVSVSSRNLVNGVELRVKDNGIGIPQRIVDKIFQPFFTTKPTGLGTGLGLSLSYDVITKQHGGVLKVETVEGEFSEFVITLPKT